MERAQSTRSAVLAATLCAGAMIAQQVGAKATRDAVFLSNYSITSLPTMLVLAALVSIGVVLLTTRLLSRYGPGRLIPPAFALSAVLLLGQWFLLERTPRLAAVVVYLHVAVFGSALISGFWSLVNERFDPRTARKHMARIGAASTLGGLLGGLMAERVAAQSSASMMLLLLAALHLICAVVVRGVVPPSSGRGAAASEPAAREQDDEGVGRLGLRTLRNVPYLRDLAVLVLLGTVGAALLDYVFKEAASERFQGETLLRFFAAFYTVSGVVTFLVQATLGRLCLERLGLARTVAILPFGVTVGSLLAMGVPGLASATGVRGAEAALRSSLFRSAYELLYTPISPRQKRATKTFVDVGFDRLGDAVGGLLIRAVILLGPAIARSAMLLGAAGLGLFGLWIARRLQRGYVKALEDSLMVQAGAVDLPGVMQSGSYSISGEMIDSGELQRRHTQQSLMDIPLVNTWDGAASFDTDEPEPPPDEASDSAIATVRPAVDDEMKGGAEPPARTALLESLEPLVAQVADLRSADVARIRRALRRESKLHPSLVSHVLILLAWDEVYAEVIRSLRTVAPEVVGQLLDHLLDPEEEFAIRRRIPRVLSTVDGQRAVDGLLEGLSDRRFEVRYQCGRALATIRDRDHDRELRMPRRQVFTAVNREVAVDKRVWESQRLLDRAEERGVQLGEDTPLFDEFVRYRSSRSMEHVFTLLSLALPKEPLRVAFRGLHTTDEVLRGTALEYLESVLPSFIRVNLWPFLEDHRPLRRHDRDRDQILEELLRSQLSIELNLKDLRAEFERGHVRGRASDSKNPDDASS